MGGQTVLDLKALRAYLDETAPGLVTGPLEATLLAGGHSNLTFALSDGEHRWVLRRPPLGHTDPSSHDMSREYRVTAALGGSDVPVAPAVLEHRGTSVLGVPFYLSEFVDGVVYRTVEQTATLGAATARALAFELMDVLADLHALDPATVGLGHFGRPEGFLERQVDRWTGWAEETLVDVPGARRLVGEVRSTRPSTTHSSIVHGDYRLDNLMVSGGHVAAVLGDR